MRRIAGVWALAIAALLALACAPAEESDRSGGAEVLPSGTPVVLISIDTLRSDRLPAYGYRAVATPAIDSLASESVVFEHAYSPVPLTLPAHASLFTGLNPPGHRVRDNAGYRLDAPAFHYLPRLLKDRGYSTGAAVSSWVLRGTAGLSDGFDLYEDRLTVAPRALLSGIQRNGFDTLAAASDWLGSVAEEPFFFFFHIYEPHTPHTPPPPFDTRYSDPYDGEVATSDAIIGRLLERLRQFDVYDRALVILLSDHGEGLNDHGDYEHGLLLYREALQVPLIVKLPNGERGGTRDANPASLVDILPTILDLLGESVPPGLDGRSLFAAGGESGGPIYGETVFPRLHFGWSELYSAIDYPYHLIFGPDPELYDLAADPAERNNLVRSQRDQAARLRSWLDSIDRTIADPAEEDEETRRKLAALGYLGAGRGGTTEGPLLDPKSQIHLLGQLKTAFTHYESGRYAEAETELRSLLAASPLLVDAWEQLGHSLTAQGRFEESLQPFERAMELSGGAPQVAGAIAAALLELGRLDEGRQYAELAVDRHEMSRDTLAQIAIRQGDLEAAEALVEAAIEGRGTRLGPLISRAELRLAQNRLEETLAVTDAVLSEAASRGASEELQGVHYLRGSAYARLRRLDEAAASYRREIELFPSHLAAYGRLALVALLRNDPAGAGAVLQELLSEHPTAAAHAEAVRTLRLGGDAAGASRLLAEALRRWPSNRELQGLRAAG